MRIGFVSHILGGGTLGGRELGSFCIFGVWGYPRLKDRG